MPLVDVVVVTGIHVPFTSKEIHQIFNFFNSSIISLIIYLLLSNEFIIYYDLIH